MPLGDQMRVGLSKLDRAAEPPTAGSRVWGAVVDKRFHQVLVLPHRLAVDFALVESPVACRAQHDHAVEGVFADQ